MALYSQTIKNLVSGISQQPPILRLPEQLEYQENGMSSGPAGLQKRPPTCHIKSLSPSCLVTGVKPMVHLIDRDETEQYLVMFNGQGIHLWDLEGNEKTVNYATGAQAYLNTSDPRKKLKAVTIADYTFIVNTDVTVGMSGAFVPDAWATQGALINVKSGQYGRTYQVSINGTLAANWATPDGGSASDSEKIDTNYISNILAGDARGCGWTVNQVGEGWFYITHPTIKINTVQTKDGFNNESMFGFITATQQFSNLPATAPNGFVVKVAGEVQSNADDYYLKFDSTENIWKETAKPGIQNSFDASTMPHVLVREADGTFTFKAATWSNREAGDDDSNPLPSFVGQKINDVCFIRNRLGLAAGENIVLSKSGEFFQFWMSTAVEILDTDCIDEAVPCDSVAIIYHALPFNEQLLLVSSQAQFVGKSDGIFSPKSFRIDQTTEFDCDRYVKPVGAGRNMYFTTKRAEFASVQEYYVVDAVSDVKNAQDISSHVPSFLPNNVYKLIPNTGENLILALTDGAPNTIYLYKFLFQDEQRVQASWSFWSYGSAEVLGGGFIGSTFYMLTTRGGGLFLEQMTFTYNTKDNPVEPYRAFIDRKAVSVVISSGSYILLTDETLIDLKGIYGVDLPTGATYGVLLPDGYYQTFNASDLPNGVAKLPGDLTGKQVIVGETFNFKAIFSEIMIKTVDQRGTTSDTEGRLQLKNFWVNYNDSGYFKATVDHFGKETYIYEMTARILGSGKNVLGSMPIETGKFEFPVQSVSSNCSITIESDTPTPLSLIGAGWEGNYYRRSNRI